MENQKFLSLSCPSCGASLEVGQNERRFKCAYCGKTHLVAQATPASMDSIVCPVGHHQDMIQKVSVIVQSQVIKVPNEHFPYEDTTHSSPLAKKLYSPPKPESNSLFSTDSLTKNKYVIFLLYFFLAVTFSMVISSFFKRNGFIAFSIIFLSLIFLGTTYLGFHYEKGITLFNKVILPGFEREDKQYAERLAKWQRAKDRWDRSYYCQRHDIVFVEGEDAGVPPVEFRAYLFKGDGDG